VEDLRREHVHDLQTPDEGASLRSKPMKLSGSHSSIQTGLAQFIASCRCVLPEFGQGASVTKPSGALARASCGVAAHLPRDDAPCILHGRNLLTFPKAVKITELIFEHLQGTFCFTGRCESSFLGDRPPKRVGIRTRLWDKAEDALPQGPQRRRPGIENHVEPPERGAFYGARSWNSLPCAMRSDADLAVRKRCQVDLQYMAPVRLGGDPTWGRRWPEAHAGLCCTAPMFRAHSSGFIRHSVGTPCGKNCRTWALLRCKSWSWELPNAQNEYCTQVCGKPEKSWALRVENGT